MGIPGEKFLGKDHDGWEYTSHDLWKKKLVWESYFKKYWKTEQKQGNFSIYILCYSFLKRCSFDSVGWIKETSVARGLETDLGTQQKANLGAIKEVGVERGLETDLGAE